MLAEGVGFEPTVGFPTLDFESSALNRTQPPFLFLRQPTARKESLNYEMRFGLCKMRAGGSGNQGFSVGQRFKEGVDNLKPEAGL